MKVLVPLNRNEHMEKLVEAGADELYLGFYDEKWFETFGEYADINRMSGFKQKANSNNFSEMIELAKGIKTLGRSAFLTMNANCYSAQQVEYAEENYFDAIKEAGMDGIIVSDVHLMEAAHAAGIPTVASTMCGIYNRDIARYYYNAGMRRIILPRDLSLNEIEAICGEFEDMEYEVFFMRNGCVFSDTYCLGMHRGECGATCAFIRSHPKEILSEYRGFEGRQKVNLNDYLYNVHFHHDTCGMCALYRMKEMGVSALKIVGRSDRYEAVCNDIRLAKRNIEIAQNASSEAEYLDRMEFPAHAGRKCLGGFSCYYPEVRFPEK